MLEEETALQASTHACSPPEYVNDQRIKTKTCIRHNRSYVKDFALLAFGQSVSGSALAAKKSETQRRSVGGLDQTILPACHAS